jgi:hypothetical protein
MFFALFLRNRRLFALFRRVDIEDDYVLYSTRKYSTVGCDSGSSPDRSFRKSQDQKAWCWTGFAMYGGVRVLRMHLFYATKGRYVCGHQYFWGSLRLSFMRFALLNWIDQNPCIRPLDKRTLTYLRGWILISPETFVTRLLNRRHAS